MITPDYDNSKIHDEFWWILNSKTREYLCSESLSDLCGIINTSCKEDDFIAMLHPNHRRTIINSMNNFNQNKVYDETFLILTKYGYRWANSKVDRCGLDLGGDRLVYGHIAFLNEKDAVILENMESNKHLDVLIDRYSLISDSLMDLMHQKDITASINKTLDNLLAAFDGDRAYIFEYDLITKMQSCVFEVVSDSVLPTKDELQNITMSCTEWWTKTLVGDKSPIICDSIESLSDQAAAECNILLSPHVKSTMVVPLITKDGIGGYIGIDMVRRYHSWTKTDIQWFQSLTNIISLCVDLKKSEDQAQTERERYVKLYENMPIGFLRLKLLYNAEGNIEDYVVINANAMVCIFFNVEEKDVLNSRGSETEPHVLDERLRYFDRIAQTKGVRNNVLTVTGDRYFDNTIYSVERDEVIILIKDITESTMAARALRKSEATLQNIYNNIPVGIEMYDKDGFLISINDKEQEIFGFEKREDVLGVNLFENPNVPKAFLDDLRNQKTSWCDFFYGFNKLNGYFKSENRGEKHIVLRGSILYDADHNVENYILIVLDNTDYLQANHKIHEFELLFNSIAEFSEVGLCKWSPYDKTISGTDQWYDNLCQKKQEFIDIMDAYSNGHPDDMVKIKKGFDDMISGNITSFRAELRIRSNDSWKWLRCTYKVSDYRPQDNKIDIIAINIDITELKNTESKLIEAKFKAEESDRLKSAFIANMSHEIRTPLNSIVGFSDLLLDADTTIEERKEYIRIIKQNNDLLLHLISDILDISKIESGMIDLKFGIVDVKEVCQELIASFPINTDIPIVLESNSEDCVISTDKLRLIQIMKNLIGNSIKFTKQGQITIGYRLDGNKMIFFVKDTGIGISKEAQKDVFVRFIKINSFTPGTGLGLPICKSLVEKLGGEIWLESELGQGSCFWFSLPLNMQAPDYNIES